MCIDVVIFLGGRRGAVGGRDDAAQITNSGEESSRRPFALVRTSSGTALMCAVCRVSLRTQRLLGVGGVGSNKPPPPSDPDFMEGKMKFYKRKY